MNVFRTVMIALAFVASVGMGLLSPALAADACSCHSYYQVSSGETASSVQSKRQAIKTAWLAAVKLTPEQQLKVDALQQWMETKQTPMLVDLQAKRAALHNYLETEKPSSIGAFSRLSQIHKVELNLESLRIEERLSVQRLLTEEQKKASKAFWAARMSSSTAGCGCK